MSTRVGLTHSYLTLIPGSTTACLKLFVGQRTRLTAWLEATVKAAEFSSLYLTRTLPILDGRVRMECQPTPPRQAPDPNRDQVPGLGPGLVPGLARVPAPVLGQVQLLVPGST